MNILLVDDHPMIIEGYTSILKHSSFHFHKALSCKEVYFWLKNGNIPYAVIMDLNLPPYPDQNLYSGIDCSILIKEYAPHCKIIFITAHEEALTLYQIYRKSNPNALIVKSDFVKEDFKNLLKGNLQEPYFSIRAQKALKDIKLKASLLSSRNTEILMYLSKGFKVSQISQLIDLSI